MIAFGVGVAVGMVFAASAITLEQLIRQWKYKESNEDD